MFVFSGSSYNARKNYEMYVLPVSTASLSPGHCEVNYYRSMDTAAASFELHEVVPDLINII